MTQLSFSDFKKTLQTKKSRKAEFLEILDRIVPQASLMALFSPYYPKEPTGSGLSIGINASDIPDAIILDSRQ